MARVIVVVCMLMTTVGVTLAMPQAAYAVSQRYQIRWSLQWSGWNSDTESWQSLGTWSENIDSANAAYDFTNEDLNGLVERSSLPAAAKTKLDLSLAVGSHPSNGPLEQVALQEVTCDDQAKYQVEIIAETLDANYNVHAVSPDANMGSAAITSDADNGTYPPSTDVDILATPNQGYEFKQWTLNTANVTNPDFVSVSDSSSAAAKLTLGDDGHQSASTPKTVTATAQFEPIPYDITVATDPADGSAGSASVTVDDVDANTATVGQQVVVVDEPEEGYELVSLTYTPEGAAPIDITESKQFAMPASKVAIDATFAPITYTVSVTKAEHGTVVASLTKAAAGASVTLTATPEAGYFFVAWKVVDAEGNPIEVSSSLAAQAEDDATATTGTTATTATTGTAGTTATTGTFTMPESDVTVTATFGEGPAPVVTHTITFNKNAAEATGTMDPQIVADNTSTLLKKNAFTLAGYTFTEWNTAADGKGRSFKDEAAITVTSDVTLYAQWTTSLNGDSVARQINTSAQAPTMGTSAGGAIRAHDTVVTFTISQLIPKDIARVRIWFDLNETMMYTIDADGITVQAGSSTIVPTSKFIDGQHLEVVIDDAAQYEGKTVHVSYPARLRDDANLDPYLSSNNSFAMIPYQAHTEFWFTDGTNKTLDSKREVVKLGNKKSTADTGSGTTVSSLSSTATPRTSGLAKTADALSVASIAVTTVTGIAAVASGGVRRRRRQDRAWRRPRRVGSR